VSEEGTTVLTVAYDGAAFHGFARQPGLVTVQGTLESALRTVTGREVGIVGAGRTDAGVHAHGQVASFAREPGDPQAARLQLSLNALAGPDIVVTAVRSAVEGFSARHDAVLREYRYLLVPGPTPPLALRGRAWWVKKPLDLDAMRDGATRLVGEHDFRSFCVTESARDRRTVRDIDDIEILRSCELGEECVVVRVAGRSFLHSMVRTVVGSLVDVGRGKRDPAWISSALQACRREAAGITAPPQGLTLWHVTYPEECWL
jgi:tRNA pseudouridine38-40 synthase